MHYTKSTIASFIYHAGLLVHNSRHIDDVKNAVVRYGYDESRMSRGELVFEELKATSVQQHKAKVLKAAKFKEKQNLQKKVHKAYMKYLKIARIAFADDLKARSVLGLDGPRKRTYREWHYQVGMFCSIMLKNDDAFLDIMSGYGIIRREIEQLSEGITDLKLINDECVKAAGELKKLTAQKKRLVIEMQGYMSDFIKIARIALEDSPKALKSLGVEMRN